MNRYKFVITALIAVILLGILVFFADLQLLKQFIVDNPKNVLIYFIIFSLVFLTRVFRTYFLLDTINHESIFVLSFLPSGLIGGAIATFGPLKSGEILAMELYYQELGIERGKSMAVAVVSRIFDISIVIIFTSFIIFLIRSSYTASLYLTLFFIITIVGLLVLIITNRRIGMALLDGIEIISVGPLIHIYQKIRAFAIEYYENLPLVVQQKRSTIHLAFWTLSRWIIETILFFIVFSNFGISLTIIELITIIGASYAVGVASASPGALGSFQLTALFLLEIYQYPLVAGANVLLLLALISVTSNVIFGLIGYFSILLPIKFKSIQSG